MFVSSSRRGDPAAGRPAPLPAATRAFHWATAASLVAMFASIWTAGALGSGPGGATLVNLHRSIGLTLLGLVIARLGWRLAHPLPPLPAGTTPGWERWLARGVQAGLYAALLAMPPPGWAASATAGDTVRLFGLALPHVLAMDETSSDRLFAAHGTVATALLVLVALHVAGALRHRFVLRDGVAERMVGRRRT